MPAAAASYRASATTPLSLPDELQRGAQRLSSSSLAPASAPASLDSHARRLYLLASQILAGEGGDDAKGSSTSGQQLPVAFRLVLGETLPKVYVPFACRLITKQHVYHAESVAFLTACAQSHARWIKHHVTSSLPIDVASLSNQQPLGSASLASLRQLNHLLAHIAARFRTRTESFVEAANDILDAIYGNDAHASSGAISNDKKNTPDEDAFRHVHTHGNARQLVNHSDLTNVLDGLRELLSHRNVPNGSEPSDVPLRSILQLARRLVLVGASRAAADSPSSTTTSAGVRGAQIAEGHVRAADVTKEGAKLLKMLLAVTGTKVAYVITPIARTVAAGLDAVKVTHDSPTSTLRVRELMYGVLSALLSRGGLSAASVCAATIVDATFEEMHPSGRVHAQVAESLRFTTSSTTTTATTATSSTTTTPQHTFQAMATQTAAAQAWASLLTCSGRAIPETPERALVDGAALRFLRGAATMRGALASRTRQSIYAGCEVADVANLTKIFAETLERWRLAAARLAVAALLTGRPAGSDDQFAGEALVLLRVGASRSGSDAYAKACQDAVAAAECAFHPRSRQILGKSGLSDAMPAIAMHENATGVTTNHSSSWAKRAAVAVAQSAAAVDVPMTTMPEPEPETKEKEKNDNNINKDDNNKNDDDAHASERHRLLEEMAKATKRSREEGASAAAMQVAEPRSKRPSTADKPMETPAPKSAAVENAGGGGGGDDDDDDFPEIVM